jgi:tetratricopeptide (TPR) repeat protein
VSEKAAAMMTALGTLFKNWALTLSSLGRPLDAERVFRRAIEISKADEKNEDAVSPMLLLNYGRTLGNLGRYDEARDYLRRAAAGARRTGFKVVQVQSLIVQAGIERAAGNPKAAAAATSELEPMLRAVYPPGHAGFASLISQRAMNAQADGDIESAAKLSDEAVSMVEASLAARKGGEDFLPLLLQRRAEVHLLNPRSSPAMAEADARRSLELLLRTDSKTGRTPLLSTVTGKSYLLLARSLRARQQPSHEAYRSAWEHYHNAAGPQHPQTVEALAGLQSSASPAGH